MGGQPCLWAQNSMYKAPPKGGSVQEAVPDLVLCLFAWLFDLLSCLTTRVLLVAAYVPPTALVYGVLCVS